MHDILKRFIYCVSLNLSRKQSLYTFDLPRAIISLVCILIFQYDKYCYYLLITLLFTLLLLPRELLHEFN